MFNIYVLYIGEIFLPLILSIENSFEDVNFLIYNEIVNVIR